MFNKSLLSKKKSLTLSYLTSRCVDLSDFQKCGSEFGYESDKNLGMDIIQHQKNNLSNINMITYTTTNITFASLKNDFQLRPPAAYTKHYSSYLYIVAELVPDILHLPQQN